MDDNPEGLRQFQAVKQNSTGHRGYIALFNDDGKSVMFQPDVSCRQVRVLISDLQPASIKKSYGVEGNNFID